MEWPHQPGEEADDGDLPPLISISQQHDQPSSPPTTAQVAWTGENLVSQPGTEVRHAPETTRSAENGRLEASPSPDVPVVWRVVGGTDRGGILVRIRQDLSSPQEQLRLSTGALVQELELSGERLHYELISGSGPPSGWVSVKLRERDLLIRAADAVPERRMPRVAKAAARPAAYRVHPIAESTTATAAAEGSTSNGGSSYDNLGARALRELCRSRGIHVDLLESCDKAAGLLQRIDRIDTMTVAELNGEIRSRGFPQPLGTAQDVSAAERFKQVLLWERLKAAELKRMCRRLRLAVKGSESREDLLQMLRDAFWAERGVPAWRLSSMTVACGLLDQFDGMEAQACEELVRQCRQRQLPVEEEPKKEVLLNRLRSHILWGQLSDAELRKECDDCGLMSAADELDDARLPGWRIREELMRRLVELMWLVYQVTSSFEALGLPATATLPEVRRAHEKLTMELRESSSNVSGPARREPRRVTEINEAYEMLVSYLGSMPGGAEEPDPVEKTQQEASSHEQERTGASLERRPNGNEAHIQSRDESSTPKEQGIPQELAEEPSTGARASNSETRALAWASPNKHKLRPGTAVLLARHGERLDDAEGRRGRLWVPSAERPWDPPLTDVGRRQAQALGRSAKRHAERLGLRPLSRIFTSPFVRCVDTAAEVARETGIESVCVEPSLSESFCEHFYRSWCVPLANGDWGGPAGCGIGVPVASESLRPAAHRDAGTLLVPLDSLDRASGSGAKPEASYEAFVGVSELKYKWDNFESDDQLHSRMRAFFDFAADTCPGETIMLVSHGGPLQALYASVQGTTLYPGYCSLFLLHREFEGDGEWTSPVVEHMKQCTQLYRQPQPTAPSLVMPRSTALQRYRCNTGGPPRAKQSGASYGAIRERPIVQRGYLAPRSSTIDAD